MKKGIFFLSVVFAFVSCIQITNENKAINGNNDEGGNNITQEGYAYQHNEYSEQNTGSYNNSPSRNATPSGATNNYSNGLSIHMSGTAANNSCSLQYSSQTGEGEFIQYLSNGGRTVRSLRMVSNDGSTLIFDAYDTKGQRVSQFRGRLTNNGTRYSGTITNNKGGSINFDVSQ